MSYADDFTFEQDEATNEVVEAIRNQLAKHPLSEDDREALY